MIKINKSSTFLAVLNKDYSVSIVEEIPEKRVCFELRTMTNIEVAELTYGYYKHDPNKLVKEFQELDVEKVSEEDLNKLAEKITKESIALKKFAKDFLPKFVVKIHNSNISLDELHIDFIDALLNKISTESITISEDDALFFG